MAAEVVETNSKPPVIEGPGRYVVYATPDGGWLVARAVGTCQTCQDCGCGEQAEPIVLPPMIISLASKTGKGKLLGMLKAASKT